MQLPLDIITTCSKLYLAIDEVREWITNYITEKQWYVIINLLPMHNYVSKNIHLNEVWVKSQSLVIISSFKFSKWMAKYSPLIMRNGLSWVILSNIFCIS